MILVDFITSFLGGSVATAVIGFLGRDWLALRIKTAIERETNIRNSIFELKRSACLDALDVVDSVFSQRDWGQDVDKQSVSIKDARRAHNQLALTCDNPEILELYVKTLGLRTPDEPPGNLNADSIVDLRNAMRDELDFGKKLKFDRNKAWVAKLPGTNNNP